MDNDSTTARVERTFWTVWNYIAGAVGRFFRPEPTSIVTSDPNSIHGSAVDSEPANCVQAEGDASGGGVDEEQPLATGPVLSSSRPVVAWELCTTAINSGPDEESLQYQLVSESVRREQSEQEGNDKPGLLVAEDAKDETEEMQKLSIQGRDEMQETGEDEEHANARLVNLTGDAVGEDLEETEGKVKITIEEKEEDKMHCEDLEAGDPEVQASTITALSVEEDNNMQREQADTTVKHQEEEDSDGVTLLASDNDNKSDEGAKHVEDQPPVCEELSDDDRDFKGDPSLSSVPVESQMAYDNRGIVFDDELITVGQDHVMAYGNESDKVEKEENDERQEGPVIEEEDVNEATNNQTMDEEEIISDTEDDISTKHVANSQEFIQDAQTEFITVEFIEGEQDDVEDIELQTKTRVTDDVETQSDGEVMDGKSDMTTTDISVAEKLFDDNKERGEEERLSSEAGDEESYMKVIVNPRGETGQDISREFENTSPGTCEGRLVVSLELNSPTCEEAREGVPEYNNEPGPDENTTQRFLEVGHYEEMQTSQLPEEVESKELESLQICSTGVESPVEREHWEEEQESTEDNRNSLNLVVEEYAEIPPFADAGLPQEAETPLVEPVVEESGVLFEEEEEKLSLGSMKTGTERSEKEFEIQVGTTDETEKSTKELQDGTKELLVDCQIDEGLCAFKEADAADNDRDITGAEATASLKFLEAEVQKMEELSFCQDPADANKSEQTTALPEDSTESGFLKQAIEAQPKLLEDSTPDEMCLFQETVNTIYLEQKGATSSLEDFTESRFLHQSMADPMLLEVSTPEIQDAGIDVKDYGVEERAGETEVQKMAEMSFFQELEAAISSQEDSTESGFNLEQLTENEPKLLEGSSPDEMKFLQESVDATSLEQSPTLQEDSTESGFSVETEPMLLEVSTSEIQDAGIDVEDYGVEERAGETEVQKMAEMSFFQELEAAISLQEDSTESGFSVETEPILLEGSTPEVQADEKAAENEVKEIAEISFFQKSTDDINSEQNSDRTPSLLEDISESGFLKQAFEMEPKLLEEKTPEIQDAGIEVEETGCGADEENAEEEVKNKSERVVEMTEVSEKELITEFESRDKQNQLSEESLEISHKETEEAQESLEGEFTPKDLTVISAKEDEMIESKGSYTEESPVSGHEDGIDEELLDLWIQTASSEDADAIRHQKDTETEQSIERQDEISPVQIDVDKEEAAESDAEMSSSTAESGFSDQSLCESTTQSSEAQLQKSTSTGSFQGICDTSESADVSELFMHQHASESQDTWMEEAAEIGQSNLKQEESGTETGVLSSEAGDLNEESDKSQEKTDKESESQKELDSRVTDPKWTTDLQDSEEVKDAKVEAEPLEMPESQDEAGGTDSGRSRSGSEDMVSTESGSQGDILIESVKEKIKLPSLDTPLPRCSEVDQPPGLERAEVQEQLTSEDLMKLDSSLLDFTAQRSRIAVKNPRVRPPKDPRSLLHLPSLEPTPSSRLPVKVPAGLPMGGIGIGIKLPGLGAGFPVLKKTQRVIRDENSQETLSKEPEKKPEEESDCPKQDVAQHKPKWMPPRHPGFGNPLMSELKTKLKKTTQE